MDIEKVDIEEPKLDIENVLSQKGSGFSVKTTAHIHRLFDKFGFDGILVVFTVSQKLFLCSQIFECKFQNTGNGKNKRKTK